MTQTINIEAVEMDWNGRLRNIGVRLVFTAIYVHPTLMKDKYLKAKLSFY